MNKDVPRDGLFIYAINSTIFQESHSPHSLGSIIVRDITMGKKYDRYSYGYKKWRTYNSYRT